MVICHSYVSLPEGKLGYGNPKNYSYALWLAVYLPLWKIWISWDDEIPNWMESQKFMFDTTNQLLMVNLWLMYGIKAY